MQILLHCCCVLCEVWMGLAEVEVGRFSLVAEARAVYREAIDVVPSSAVLRVAFAVSGLTCPGVSCPVLACPVLSWRGVAN